MDAVALPADVVAALGTQAVLSEIYIEPEDMVPVESPRLSVMTNPVELDVLTVNILVVAANVPGVILPKASDDPSVVNVRELPEIVACGYNV